MPKQNVKTVPVIIDVFREILSRKGSSIRKLGAESSIQCSEKTIRRELKEKGGLRQQYVDQIAKYLNVDSRLLTGELVKAAFETDDMKKRMLLLYPLKHIENYPYFREEQSRLYMEGIDETIRRVLSLFEISYHQYERKSFDEQYEFHYDMISALTPIMYKHFDRDGYGDTERISFQKVLHDLENYKDEYYFRRYLDITLRNELISNPPAGYSKKQIEKMTIDELDALDTYMQWAERDK